MRRGVFGAGEYYHVYNRGVNKCPTFLHVFDYERFLLSIFAFRDTRQVEKLARACREKISFEQKFEQLEHRPGNSELFVEVVAFCLMPNHFHLLLKEVAIGGISKFMQKLGISYTRYLNLKHERTGHLFGGAFHAIRIDTDAYLLQLVRYIHRNPSEIGWAGRLVEYPWSSHRDYVDSNRWGKALHTEIMLGQFQTREGYRQFVESGS